MANVQAGSSSQRKSNDTHKVSSDENNSREKQPDQKLVNSMQQTIKKFLEVKQDIKNKLAHSIHEASSISAALQAALNNREKKV